MKARRVGENCVFLLLFLTIAAGSLFPPNLQAEQPVIGVIYPQMRDPYRSVFEAIIAGMENAVNHRVRRFEIVEDAAPGNGRVLEWIQKERVKTVVALGKQGLEAAKVLPAEINVVIGAVLTPPEPEFEAGGIVLSPAPERLFDWLTLLAPQVKKVTVVYNPDINGWLMAFAETAARKHGLALNALPARDLRTAAQLYRDLVNAGLGAEHAIWLPQDSYTVDQQTTLPMLLKASWDQKFVVFSSNPAHVKRGALFGLYPDNVKMGERLGRLAIKVDDGEEVKKFPIEPLMDLLVAVNVRTADHLQLNFGKNLVETFDLTFPATR